MTSHALTVEQYLAELPEDRKGPINAIRDAVLANLPDGLEECMNYGMIGYVVPHSLYPNGYHCDPKQPLPCINIASQKNHMAVYMFCVYIDGGLRDWFVEEYKKTGKKIDMGQSCVRFKKFEDFPLELFVETLKKVTVDGFISVYEKSIPESSKSKRSKKPTKA